MKETTDSFRHVVECSCGLVNIVNIVNVFLSTNYDDDSVTLLILVF